jgi:hypothetical protein
MANDTAATPTSTPIPELTLPEVSAHFAGQKKINGMLCEVDWMLIGALNQVATILENRGDNVAALTAWLKKIDTHSAKVANEDPPGCSPRDRTGQGGI